ncbi:MAG: U32 family peptidase, partial [Ruthenibacterium sp.]
GDFNARRGAKNVSSEEFSGAVAACHLYGVKVYLTLNTLLSDRELLPVAEVAREASALGVDAVLVQDLGVLSLLREIVPDLPLHASTQMTLLTSGGAAEAAALGLSRVV